MAQVGALKRPDKMMDCSDAAYEEERGLGFPRFASRTSPNHNRKAPLCLTHIDPGDRVIAETLMDDSGPTKEHSLVGEGSALRTRSCTSGACAAFPYQRDDCQDRQAKAQRHAIFHDSKSKVLESVN